MSVLYVTGGGFKGIKKNNVPMGGDESFFQSCFLLCFFSFVILAGVKRTRLLRRRGSYALLILSGRRAGGK